MDVDERVVAVTEVCDFAGRLMEATQESAEATQATQTQLLFAREFLEDVQVTDDQMKRFAEESARGGCEGHRAEVFATKIARAHAALNGRDCVSSEDVQMGIKLAIIPRIRVRNNAPEDEEEEMPPPPPPPPPPEAQDEQEQDQDEEPPDEQEEEDNPEDEEEDQESEEQQELPE